MAATKVQKAPNRQSNISAPPPPRSPPPESVVNGKKKKKKKGKPRGLDPNLPSHPAFADDDDDDVPQLEPVASHHSVHRTGLSPELESVHLSTTASLSASAAAAARLNATAAAQAELLATANDLYRRMDTDSMPDDDDYWASLPSHIKNFVKMTYSQSTNPNVNQNERTKAQSMFAIAQQMIQSGAGRTSPKGGQGQPPGAYPSTLPFDPSIFSDPAFNLAMEQTLAASGPLPPAPGQPPRGPLPPTNVVLLNEFGSEDHQPMDDDYYSEDEVDDNVDDPDDTPAFAGYEFGPATKKKSKKKKKKGAPNPPPAVVPPTLAPNPPTPLPAPTHPMPASRPPPAAATHPAPLTSSRAAGKQPMSYTAPAPAAAPPPSRTSRAASKAPLPAHAYSHAHHHPSPPSSQTSNKTRPPAAPPKNNKLWSTNSTEERERIKEFWLGLGEEERRALVKVEKEAVLKKMKEQQKHSCSCAVCGRKRNAIEEELEVLYDAYYEELEQYANHQQQYASSGGTIPPPPGPGPFPGSVELDKNGAVVGGPHHHGKNHHPSVHPPRAVVPPGKGVVNGRKKPESEFDDEDADEEEYEEDEDYEEEEEDEEEEEEEADEEVEEDEPEDKRPPRRTATVAPPPRGRQPAPVNGVKPNGRDDFFNFGNNLTVTGPGNILTVADDLLKNDGQKFLEMMEQLAERRMQREEEAAAEVGMDSEDEDEDEEGDEEDEEDDEDDEDDEEEEVMTEEQKMEEGKRMFSIFAARMFEQRVLQAYREKVAQERQLQLLRELEDEDKAAQEKEAKKQKENQKKKAKKQLQKQAKEEERRQREADKAAEEASLKAKLEAQEEEMRKKREEERARREALRKAQEEERARKEEERRKRVAEEKERQAEQERKKRERDEKLKAERRDREEKERKEKEAKIAADKAAAAAKREQQEKEERERRLQKEAEERKERENRERLQRERSSLPKGRAVPTSPRNATGGPSRGAPAIVPKKILTKPVTLAASSSSSAPAQPNPRQSQQRPAIITQAPNPIAPQPQHPVSGASSSHMHSPAPSTTPISIGGYHGQFPSPNGPIPSSMSPRSAAPPFSNGPPAPSYMPYGSGGSVPPGQGLPPPPLGPSALPRGYPVGPGSFDAFPRPLGPPAAIGPPQKGLPNPPGSPIGMFSPAPGPSTGHLRRGSVQDRTTPTSSFGVVQRPIAPIARPNTSKEDDRPASSPKLKSPSSTPAPETVLGSSALVPDDDEPILPPGRRVVVGAVGQIWGTPQEPISARGGWTGSQSVSFTTPGRAPNGMWSGSNPEQWPGGFPQHSPFAAFAVPSPPPGSS